MGPELARVREQRQQEWDKEGELRRSGDEHLQSQGAAERQSCETAELQRCGSAEMQKCRDAERRSYGEAEIALFARPECYRHCCAALYPELRRGTS